MASAPADSAARRVSRSAALPFVRGIAPGLLLCIALAVGAYSIGAIQQAVGGRTVFEPLVVALVLGAALRTVYRVPTRMLVGSRFAAKQVLEVAVAVLGISIDLSALLAAGASVFVVIAVGMAIGFGVAFWAARSLGLNRRLASLVAIGNAVCGNSAIAALAPIVQATSDEVAASVAITAVLGLVLVLALPVIGAAVATSDYQYGVVTGLSVYAVPQVLAAAAFKGAVATDVALLVKLTRVVLLTPIILIAAFLTGKGPRTRGLLGYVPWFVWGFAAFAVVRTLGFVPLPVASFARDAGGALTTVAMVGLGLGVDLRAIQTRAPRVALAVATSLIALVASAMVLVHLLVAR